jgi:hypothetical protein
MSFAALLAAAAAVLAGCPQPGQQVVVDPTTAEVFVGQSTDFGADSTQPGDSFTWESSNEAVATVNGNGFVTGQGVGEAIITATGTQSGASDSATVTVRPLGEAEVREQLQREQMYVEDIPREEVTDDAKDALAAILQDAYEAYIRGNTCEAAQIMETYLAEAQMVRAEENRFAGEELYNRGDRLLFDLIQLSDADCPGFERTGRMPETRAVVADRESVAANQTFGKARLLTVEHPDGEVFTQINIPGLPMMSGAPGAPGIPAVRKLIAIPHAYEGDIVVNADPVVAEQLFANVYPYQEQPVDQSGENGDPQFGEEYPGLGFFGDRPFLLDDAIYDADALYPSDVVQVTRLGRFRDLELAVVEVAAGQYNAITHELHLFSRVSFEVEFDDGAFVSEATFAPFESSPEVYLNTVLNEQVVRNTEPLEWSYSDEMPGEELMIFAHPDFEEAAMRLRDHKRTNGVMANVYLGGTGSEVEGRQTKEEIDAFIEDHYANAAVRPTYVLLMGDAEFIEPWGEDGIGTDWPYAAAGAGLDSDPLTPSFAVGRLPVDTLEQAHVLVDKIIDYENTPPGSPFEQDAFYTSATLAAQFRCCRPGVGPGMEGVAERTFTEAAEFVGDALREGGYTVERIYAETVANGYEGDPTPRFYYDLRMLPPAISPDSGFAWNGSTQDVINAFNGVDNGQGRFLMLHRGDGWSNGWGAPRFETSDIAALSNGDCQPVVYSINCTSGYFDNETRPGGVEDAVFWAEELLRVEDAGAIGIVAPTRVSPSWPNTALTKGLFDATWPETVPDFGGEESIRRLGDVLNRAKLFLPSDVSVAGAGDFYSYVRDMARLYHLLGDPTLAMWTEDPDDMDLPTSILVEQVEGGLELDYAMSGAVVTAYQLILPPQDEEPAPEETKQDDDPNGDEEEPDPALLPIGRTVIGEEGEAMLEFFIEPQPETAVKLVANMPGAVSQPLPDFMLEMEEDPEEEPEE